MTTKGVQQSLFSDQCTGADTKCYKSVLTACENGKGVLDVDTVKGCSLGMLAHPDGGCYGECYAYKTAHRYGIDFSRSITRRLYRSNRFHVFSAVKNYYASWYRVGTAGDPSHDWDNTIDVLKFLSWTKKTPVIITKHWIPLTTGQLKELSNLGAVINTSVSGLDSDDELHHRINQMNRIKAADIKSVCRVVTCLFSQSRWGKERKEKQDWLLSLNDVIDTPLRASNRNKYVERGDILLTKKQESVGGGKFVSLHHNDVYLGTCGGCPDQCGADHAKKGF